MRLSIFVLLVTTLFAVPTPPARTWVELGPHSSGRVSAITATDAMHIWAASPGGGIWKTSDGGAHWTSAGNYGLGEFTALDLALDRNDPRRMYLRVWNGFLVSTDGGAHWTQTLYSQGSGGGDTSFFQPSFTCGVFPACPPYATSPLFEPRPFTQMVFAGRRSILLTALPCGGLQYSTNSGTSFTQLWPFAGTRPQTNGDNCIFSIAADEATGKVYIATGGNGSGDPAHIYRSSAPWTPTGPPSSLHWELVNSGIPGNVPADSLVWGGSANRLMAMVNGIPYLFNGTTWVAKPARAAGCLISGARALVWGGGDDFFVGGNTFAYTVNAGNTWVCPALNQQYVDIRAIHADRNLRRVWIGADNSALESHFVISSYPWNPGVGLGTPVGSTGLGISSWQAYTVALPPGTAHHNRVLVGAQDIASACSDDDGAYWSLVPTDESQGLVWRSSGSGDVVYSYSTLGTMERSTNAGTASTCAAITFTNVSPPDTMRESKAFVGPHTVAVHPRDVNKIFTVTFRSVIYSTTGGTNWARSSFTLPGVSNPPGPASIFVDENGALYVGTVDGGAFTCGDAVHFCDGSAGSGHWTPWGLNAAAGTTPPRVITAIAESNAPPAPRTFWMATSDGIYRKAPGAAAWVRVPTNSGYVYNEVLVDPNCHSRIYAGVGYLDPISRSRGGILFSSDNGNSWTSLSSGFDLHGVPITQVIVAPGSPNRVLASTYGRGSWEYNWGTALPACAP